MVPCSFFSLGWDLLQNELIMKDVFRYPQNDFLSFLDEKYVYLCFQLRFQIQNSKEKMFGLIADITGKIINMMHDQNLLVIMCDLEN